MKTVSLLKLVSIVIIVTKVLTFQVFIQFKTPLHQVLIWERYSVIIFISGRSFPGSVPIITIIVVIVVFSVVNVVIVVVVMVIIIRYSDLEFKSQVSLAEPGSGAVQQQFENGDVVVTLLSLLFFLFVDISNNVSILFQPKVTLLPVNERFPWVTPAR